MHVDLLGNRMQQQLSVGGLKGFWFKNGRSQKAKK